MTSQEEPAEPATRRGFLLLADVFVNPKRAFGTIAVTREWLPAFVAVIAAQLLEGWLVLPAVVHVQNLMITSGPHPTLEATFFLNALIQTLIYLMMWVWTAAILAAFSGNVASGFGAYFALAVNAALPAAIGTVVFGVVIHAHDAAAFSNFSQINRAVPDSLALLEPRDNDRAVSFLAEFDLFTLWSMLLVAFGFRSLAGVRLVPALVTALTLWLAAALLDTAVPTS